jgi:hypothetical protein
MLLHRLPAWPPASSTRPAAAPPLPPCLPPCLPSSLAGPGTYGIEETAFWSERVYTHVFRLLNEYGVVPEAILLKPNMCLPGEGEGGRRTGGGLARSSSSRAL